MLCRRKVRGLEDGRGNFGVNGRGDFEDDRRGDVGAVRDDRRGDFGVVNITSPTHQRQRLQLQLIVGLNRNRITVGFALLVTKPLAHRLPVGVEQREPALQIDREHTLAGHLLTTDEERVVEDAHAPGSRHRQIQKPDTGRSGALFLEHLLLEIGVGVAVFKPHRRKPRTGIILVPALLGPGIRQEKPDFLQMGQVDHRALLGGSDDLLAIVVLMSHKRLDWSLLLTIPDADRHHSGVGKRKLHNHHHEFTNTHGCSPLLANFGCFVGSLTIGQLSPSQYIIIAHLRNFVNT